jgi:hypothetical protein
MFGQRLRLDAKRNMSPTGQKRRMVQALSEFAQRAPAAERPVCSRLRASCGDAECHPFRLQAARANRFAQEAIDPLTRERLQGLAADYLRQAIELEGSGRTAPPDIDPTE